MIHIPARLSASARLFITKKSLRNSVSVKALFNSQQDLFIHDAHHLKNMFLTCLEIISLKTCIFLGPFLLSECGSHCLQWLPELISVIDSEK